MLKSYFLDAEKKMAALRRAMGLLRKPAKFRRVCSPSLQTPELHGHHAFPQMRKQTAAGWILTSRIL